MPDTRKDADALENERGRLWVTKQLLATMERSIEDAADDLRLMEVTKEIDKTILNEKLVALGAFAEALSERADASLEAIDTILNSLNRE